MGGKSEISLGRVIGASPPNPNPPTIGAPVLSADILPLDYSTYKVQTPLAFPYGFLRMPRRGQTVVLGHVAGMAQVPLGFMHIFNLEQNPTVADPLPTDAPDGNLLLEYIDDLVIYHDETYAFTRFRCIPTGGPVGSPMYVELLRGRSGFEFLVSEYAPENPDDTTPPPAPTRAKLSITMPQGATFIIDEPAADQTAMTLTLPTGAGATFQDDSSSGAASASISMPSGASWTMAESSDSDTTLGYTHPSGTTITVDNDGNVVISSARKVTVQADTEVLLDCSDVQIGGEGGKTLSFFEELEAHRTWASTHTHSGVETGGGASGPPIAPPPTPVGTLNTFAI